MQKILIINAGWEQIDIISKAKTMGLYVIATDISKYAPGFELADEGIVIEPRNLPALLNIALDKKIDAVVADQCDYSYYAAAYIADYLGLPGSGLDAAQNTTNKKWMRTACKTAGIKQPEYIPCKTMDEINAAITKIGYPCIIKPLDNRGNFGVNLVDDDSQVKDAFFEAIANAHSRECLVERFIEGTMITVDGFAFSNGEHRSLAVASKIMLGGRKRVAIEIDYPAQINPGLIKELQVNHNKVAKALAINQGCTHGEYMLTKEGEIYLIECANRGGGCFTSSRIVPTVSGYDLSELLINMALGKKVISGEDAEEMKAAAVLSFFTLPPGKVQEIKNEDIISTEKDVLAFRLAVKPGEYINTITNDANRHGFVITRGYSLEAARETAQKAKETLVVTYD